MKGKRERVTREIPEVYYNCVAIIESAAFHKMKSYLCTITKLPATKALNFYTLGSMTILHSDTRRRRLCTIEFETKEESKAGHEIEEVEILKEREKERAGQGVGGQVG